jgi:putative protein kinase ArgK-like GTPase of G3E family
MITSVLVLAVAVGMALAATAVAFFAIYRAGALVKASEARAKADRETSQEANASLRTALDSLTAQFQELRNQPQVVSTPSIPKLGLNLNKRSQALRMHRRGDSPETIASTLEIPRQEIDLLLKVHQIVISNVN